MAGNAAPVTIGDTVRVRQAAFVNPQTDEQAPQSHDAPLPLPLHLATALGHHTRRRAGAQSTAARDPGPVRSVATGFNGDRGRAMLGVKGQMRLAALCVAFEPG